MPARLIHLRLKTFVLQLVLLVAAFVAGWYSPAWMAKPASASANNSATPSRSATKNPADELAEAKSRLGAILKMPLGNDRERDLLSFADGLDAKTTQGLLADLAAHSTLGRNANVMSVLIARLVELDPQAALSALKNIHDPNVFPVVTNAMFDAWSAADPAAAFAAINQLPANDFRYVVQEEVLLNMVDQNPEAALLAVRNQPSRQAFFFIYEAVFAEWAQNDPSSAATAAFNLPASNARSYALDGIAKTWAAQDPDSALAWAKALTDGPEKTDAITSVIETISQQDPASAATYALQLPNTPKRNQLMIDVASNWSQTDPSAALAWADKNLTGDTYVYAVSDSLSQMGQVDPAGAAAALAKISDPAVASKAIPEIAIDWAEQDVQAAMQWAQSLPTDNVAVRNSALTNVLKLWTFNDPVGAATYLQQNLAADPSFGTDAAYMVNIWGASDPQAALTWAQNLPAGDAQNSVVNAALTQLAAVDPQTAWNDAAQLSGNSGVQAQVNVINAWAAQQPALAAAALSDIPPGSNLDTATADVAKNWLAQNPSAATQWINTLPQGAARDSAVTQLVSNVGNNDPASALTWAISIGDPATRDAQVVNLLNQWSGNNPTAAAKAAQNAMGTLDGLTSDQQTALQKIAGKVSVQ